MKFKNPFKKWIGSCAEQQHKTNCKPCKAVLELFKDNKGKWSSKRTVSGVIVLALSRYNSSWYNNKQFNTSRYRCFTFNFFYF